MSFLNINNKIFLITGVANKKSVAFHSAKILSESGAELHFCVQSTSHEAQVNKLFPNAPVYILDVEDESQIATLSQQLLESKVKFDGLLHSIAFANFSEGIKPFHETPLKDFQQAMSISCFSLVSLSNAIKGSLNPDAAIVTISISDTLATSYGYMGPIKATLEATVAYLAKSFSEFSEIRFNAVCAGPLKTSASAGIPGYINNYITAEQFTLRKRALKTSEVANTVAFLLSPSSSGINATQIRVDAGMRCNHFDQKVVNLVADNL